MERGSGTTCVCLSFATFLANKMGMKTAYVELNTTNQIKSLSKEKNLTFFTYLGIHIFPSTKIASLSEIFDKDFDYIILDMGVLTNYTATEFSKCQKQFLVCNCSEWKREISLEKIKTLFQSTILQKEHVTILKTFENTSTWVPFSRLHLRSFPPINNPFQLPVTLFVDFTRILL